MTLILIGALAFVASSAAPARADFGGCLINQLTLWVQLSTNRFNTSRSFSTYADQFGPEFVEKLFSLGPTGHWLDAGAGEGRAIGEFAGLLKPGAKGLRYLDWSSGKMFAPAEDPALRARVTGVVYSTPRGVRKEIEDQVSRSRGRYSYLSGRYIENIPRTELAPADIITDFQGPLAYSVRLSEVLNRYLDLLTLHGRVFAAFNNEITTIRTPIGTLSLIEWLRSFDGPAIRVRSEGGSVSIEKLTDAPFRFPRLQLVKVRSEIPPARVFRVLP